MNKSFPRQLRFITGYINKNRRQTFSNAYRSALNAGYSESYARRITSCLDWQDMADTLSDVLRKIIDGQDA